MGIPVGTCSDEMKPNKPSEAIVQQLQTTMQIRASQLANGLPPYRHLCRSLPRPSLYTNSSSRIMIQQISANSAARPNFTYPISAFVVQSMLAAIENQFYLLSPVSAICGCETPGFASFDWRHVMRHSRYLFIRMPSDNPLSSHYNPIEDVFSFLQVRAPQFAVV